MNKQILDNRLICSLLIFGATFAFGQASAPEPNDFDILKYNNPGLIVDLAAGLWANPIPMDFDGDGDMDLLVSCSSTPYKGLYYFENTTGDKIPVFAPGVRLGDHLENVHVSYVDGQPRILVPGAELKNFAKSLDGEKEDFLIDPKVRRQFNSRKQYVGNQWRLVDYNNDGRLDIVVGSTEWFDYGWDNSFDAEGNWTNGPVHGYCTLLENTGDGYADKGKIMAGAEPMDAYGKPGPCFADFDGDGDLDIICGEYITRLKWFENTGTRESPVYAEGRFLQNSAGPIAMDAPMIVPCAVDWDKDGHPDLVVGQEDGRVALIRNTGEVKDRMPVFESTCFFKQQADEVKFGGLTTPFAVDWNDDGKMDLVCGNASGYIGFIENLGVSKDGKKVIWAVPQLLEADGEVIRILAGKNGSIQGPVEAMWGYTTLSVADWDGDGLKDIIVNSIWGKVVWYKNIGSSGSPKLSKAQPVQVAWENVTPEKQLYYEQSSAEEEWITPTWTSIPKPAWTWWNPGKTELATQWRTTPYAIDWNKDGLMDLVMLDYEGYLAFFERFEKDGELLLKPGKRIFCCINGANYNSWNRLMKGDRSPGLLRLNATAGGQSGRRKIAFFDWDHDGDLDLISNGLNAGLFENVGTKDGLVQLKNNGNVSRQRLAGHTNSPTVADLDGDGKAELIVGAEDGHLYVFKQKISL